MLAKVKLKLKTQLEGGRKNPIHNNYRCSVTLGYSHPLTCTYFSTICQFEKLSQIDDYNYTADVDFINLEHLDFTLFEKDRVFDMFEGSRLIGQGIIL